MMMMLGTYQFALGTAAYQELTRSTAWRWPAQERIGLEPARQHLGPGEDRIELSGVIHPTFRGGLGQLDAMRAEAGRGEPLILVDGQGLVRGKWCIEGVEETQSTFTPEGAPRRIGFRLRLVRYGEAAE